MSLPSITVPPGSPCFLAEGHAITEDSVYADVAPITGHSRTRRVWTVGERVVSVRWFLEAADMARVEAWFENDLLAGSRQFSVEVRSQADGQALVWWAARWVHFETEMMALGRGTVSGQLFLVGEPSDTPPDTSALAAEISIPLMDVRSSLPLPVHLAAEVLIALTQPAQLRAEIVIALLSAYTHTGARITEDDVQRVTEDGTIRVIES